MLEVDAIDICMVFSVIKNGVKLSFRSCIKEVSASEMAQEVCRDIAPAEDIITRPVDLFRWIC